MRCAKPPRLSLVVLALSILLAGEARATGLRVGSSGVVKRKTSELDKKVAAAKFTANILAGIAAGGRPLAGALISVRDPGGNTAAGTAGANGAFSVDVTALSFPVLLRAKLGTKSYYSIADAAGTANISPFTDLVMRTFFRTARGVTDVDAAFAAKSASIIAPPSSAVSSIQAVVLNTLSPVIVRQGVNPATFDLFTTPFAANGAGFDAAIDSVSITANAAFSAVTIVDVGAANALLSTITPALNDVSVPAPATGLAAGAVASTAVTLQWTLSASTSAAGYNVYRNGLKIGASSATYFTDATVSQGTQYSYVVEAFTWAGTKAPQTSAVTVTTLVNLAVAKTGGGSGSVTSNIGGINCGTTCAADFNLNASVILTAAASGSSIFGGWVGGGCSGVGACVVAMSAAQNVTANFKIPILTVTLTGSGTGSVTSSPAGINCGATCTYTFAANAQVALTPAANSGSAFTGWSGACIGTVVPCTVTMSDALNVTAKFDLPNTLTVAPVTAGASGGTIASSPPGINCGLTCAASFPPGTSVTLTVTPNSGSSFAGWSGVAGCSGTGTCTIVMNGSQSVTTTFSPTPPSGGGGGVGGCSSECAGKYSGLFVYTYKADIGTPQIPNIQTFTKSFAVNFTLTCSFGTPTGDIFIITNKNVDDPFFNCQGGCASNPGDLALLPHVAPTDVFNKAQPGMAFALTFPGGVSLVTMDRFVGDLTVSSLCFKVSSDLSVDGNAYVVNGPNYFPTNVQHQIGPTVLKFWKFDNSGP